jgi:hypothetical protein
MNLLELGGGSGASHIDLSSEGQSLQNLGIWNFRGRDDFVMGRRIDLSFL